VGDDDDGALRAPHRVDAVCHELECVDVQARIGFVEDRQPRFEHCHLKDLVALFLAAGEAFVDRAGEHARVDLEQRCLLAHQRHELDRVELLLPAVLADRVQGRFQEVRIVHTRNLDRVLERHEHTLAGALFRIHRE
jgi:hypothetical protein